ncbi:formyl-CoA transferase [Variovorax sp. HW608]|uniref:CaiB/BaiF CoA transferase family protein n=1 Tax=Variovorax sp. HW608 TaxID=1034889 RepID=UPI00081F7AEC|nr:CaiB/BaiF CoA-transferase family protein [Variovorax sp. HW608]SCK43115.1 formyl-CoA transferase [Variovorax sp. HW608]
MNSSSEKPYPLKGVRVLDLGTMLAGPVAATLLGDFGADVIKVEQPTGGDTLRKLGPFADGESLSWHIEGRNKKSVTIDLRVSAGQKLLLELASKADVVVENFRPGTMEKWGIGYDTLSKVNPRLILLSISGYGQTGPYSSRAAYDRIALAFAGILNITGYPDRPPVRPGVAMADYQAAIFGAFGAMLALYGRDAAGGTGQHIDLALYEAVFRFTDVMVTAYEKSGAKRERQGNKHFAAAPGDHFPTSDGRYIALTVSADTVFKRLCDLMGMPSLATDERFTSHALRVENLDAINAIVADWIFQQPVAALIASLEKAGLAFSLILSVQEIAENEHYNARGSIATMDHPRLGPLKVPAVVPRMSNTPTRKLEPAPELGEHTAEILADWLGMDALAIDTLTSHGVISTPKTGKG